MRSPADAPLTAVWMDPPGCTTSVRADAGAAVSSTPRAMKERMIFLRAGVHTSACVERDKVSCVIAGEGPVAPIRRVRAARPPDPRKEGELKTSCARWMMSLVAPRPATLALRATLPGRKGLADDGTAACCWRNGVWRAVVRGR